MDNTLENLKAAFEEENILLRWAKNELGEEIDFRDPEIYDFLTNGNYANENTTANYDKHTETN